MSFSMKYMKFVVFSLIVIIFSISFNILSNRVKVHPVKPEKPLIITIDENLPLGEYTFEYYVACSSSNPSSPVLEFNLKTVDSNGEEVLFDNQKYNKAIGFGSSSFQIENIGDIVIAEFNIIEKNDKSINSAGVGNIYIWSKDGTYQNTVYAPSDIREQNFTTERGVLVNSNILLSDFATLKDFSLVGKSLELNILCTKETLDNYELGLKITSDNINSLLPDGNYYGFYPLTPDSVSWVVGEEYIQNINFTLPPGHYHIDLALSPISPNIPYYINRYKLMNNNHKINIGSVDIKGQSLSEFLRNISDKQIVIISVMDEATNALSEISFQSLKGLGLVSDLRDKIQWSYIGVTAKGVDGFKPLELLENALLEVSLTSGSLIGTFPLPFDLSVVSAGFKVGNTSSIVINEKEYSKTMRGMNIVIYDIDRNEVVSSVNFDTYLTNYN